MVTPPDRRSPCPISFVLDIFGDRWTLLVIRDLAFKRKRRFSELLASDEGIATNILADRLERLECSGIVEKARDPADGRRRIYTLTDAGKDLIPVLIEMVLWGARHDPDTGTPAAFVDSATADREALVAQLRAGLDP